MILIIFFPVLDLLLGQDLALQSGHKPCGGLPAWPHTLANLHAPLFSCESRQHPRSLSGMAYACSAAQTTVGRHFNGYLFGQVPLQHRNVYFSVLWMCSALTPLACIKPVNKLQDLVKENRKREEKTVHERSTETCQEWTKNEWKNLLCLGPEPSVWVSHVFQGRSWLQRLFVFLVKAQ